MSPAVYQKNNCTEFFTCNANLELETSTGMHSSKDLLHKILINYEGKQSNFLVEKPDPLVIP